MFVWLKKFISFIVIVFGTVIHAQSLGTEGAVNNLVIERISKDPLLFAKFHRALVLTTINEDKAFINTKDYFPLNKVSHKSSVEFVLALFVAEAVANDVGGEVCFFGGWPSVRIDGSCKKPWDERVMSHPSITELGHSYKRNENCEEKSNENFEYRTCNPVLFGPGGTASHPIEEGICLSLRKTRGKADYSKFTESCYSMATVNFKGGGKRLNNLSELYKRIQEDPEFKKKYQSHAEAIIKFCQENPNQNGNTCEPLMAIASPAVNMMCLSFGDNVTRGQLNRISSLWNSVRSDLVDLDWVSAEKMDSDIAQMTTYAAANAASSGSEVDWDGEIPESAEGMDAVAAWAKRLASKRCRGQSVNTCRDNKAPGKPTGYCWRHIKLALMKGDAVDDYIPSVNAYDAHSHRLLERRGFCNVTDNVNEAPINSILVYKRTDNRTGNPGHIEMKTGANEYVSDFITDRPISAYNGARKLVGAYVPCGDN